VVAEQHETALSCVVQHVVGRVGASCWGYRILVLLGSLLVVLGKIVSAVANSALHLRRRQDTRRGHRVLLGGFLHRSVWRTLSESVAGLLVVMGLTVLAA